MTIPAGKFTPSEPWAKIVTATEEHAVDPVRASVLSGHGDGTDVPGVLQKEYRGHKRGNDISLVGQTNPETETDVSTTQQLIMN